MVADGEYDVTVAATRGALDDVGVVPVCMSVVGSSSGWYASVAGGRV